MVHPSRDMTTRHKWTAPSGIPKNAMNRQNGFATHVPNSTHSNTNEVSSSAFNQIIGQLQAEVVHLRKEVCTLKDENSALKTKIRRLEDENLKKSKQLDKLLMASKASHPAEKKKENEAVSNLKQKCFRLEQILKDKDNELKRLQHLQKATSKPESVPVNSKNGMNKRLIPKTSAGAATVPAVEVAKLKDSMSKINVENGRLHQQLRSKENEIKNLRTQLQQAKVTSSKAIPAPVRQNTYSIPSNSQVPPRPKRFGDVQSKIGSFRNADSKVPAKRSAPTQQPPKNSEPQKKPQRPITFSRKKPTVTKVSPKPTVDSEAVEELRKNIAAKKIQRSWREHQQKKEANSAGKNNTDDDPFAKDSLSSSNISTKSSEEMPWKAEE